MLGGVERIERDQPGVVDPRIPILRELVAVLERPAHRRVAAPDRFGPRQARPEAGQYAVQRQPGADHPPRPPAGRIGQDEAQRAHQMRGVAQQDFTFVQRFAHQPEFILLQIAQPAVDQFGGGRRGVAGQIVALDQQHRSAASGRIARDRRAVDAAADDEKVELVHECPLARLP